MQKFWFAAAFSLLCGCLGSQSREAEEYGRLDDAGLERLVEKLERWSAARDSGDQILQDLIKRDLRRESGRMIDSLKLGIASSDPLKRSACAAALGFSEDVSAIPLLASLLKDGDEAVRANALLALVLIDSLRTPVEPVVACVSDPSSEVRRHAVLLLGGIALPENTNLLLPAIMSAMNDPDPEVRENASYALDCAADSRAALVLADPGLFDDSARVRLNCAVALGKMKARGAVGPLVRALKREMNKSVEREILSALSKITGKTLGSSHEAWEAEAASFAEDK